MYPILIFFCLICVCVLITEKGRQILQEKENHLFSYFQFKIVWIMIKQINDRVNQLEYVVYRQKREDAKKEKNEEDEEDINNQSPHTG